MKMTIFCFVAFVVTFFSLQGAYAATSNEYLSVIQIQVYDKEDQLVSTGSGTIIDDDGHVLTNYHVIETVVTNEDAFVMCVSTSYYESAKCGLVGDILDYDEDIDIALLRITHVFDVNNQPVAFEDFKRIHEVYFPSAYVPKEYTAYGIYGVDIGEEISIIGYPSTGGNSIHLTKGTVSGFESIEYEGQSYPWLVKTDADIDAGNSGGAAIDVLNNFIGIPTEVMSHYDTVGYLISLPIVNAFLDQTGIVIRKGSGVCQNLNNGYFDHVTDECMCNEGYAWDTDAQECLVSDENLTAVTSADQSTDPWITDQIARLAATDSSLVSRMAGRILLQVQDHGEAWYVSPEDRKRYYMKDGGTAYQMLRNFGLGITNADLQKIPVGIESRFQDTDTDGDTLPDKLEEGLKTDPLKADTDNDGRSDGSEIMSGSNPLGAGSLRTDASLVNRLRGRIVLQIESRGEAWYIHPADGKRYYMKNGDAAYQIMRYLSLGITNTDLRRIPIQRFVPVQ